MWCRTDHRLIVSKFRLRILLMRRPQSQKTAKRLNVSKLKTDKVAEEFLNDLDGRLPDMTDHGQDSTEEQWAAFRYVVYSTAYKHLGPATRRRLGKTGSMRTMKRSKHCYQKNITGPSTPERPHFPSKERCLCQCKKKSTEEAL